MKHFTLNLSFLLAVTAAGYAQPRAVDTHPESTIQAIDYTSGQEAQINTDSAILFKDAFIELVSHTTTAKIVSVGFGHKFWEIQQLDPQSDGNAFQIMFHRQIGNNVSTNYTFMYSVDQNKLSWLNPQTQDYVPVPIQGPNLTNLNNCFNYGQFIVGPPQPAADQAPAVASTGPAPTDAPADSITATQPPPPLQDEVQPQCPTDGYLWQPGSWTFNVNTGQYMWVPGAWAAPPTVGFLWTPPYWGFVNGVYLYNGGYWGATIGFYGGLNYGYGYGGDGFVGGRWEGGRFRYNTAVMRVGVNIHSTYVDRTVVYHGVRNRAAFNGPGGITRGPNPRERAEFDRHNNEVARARAVNRANFRAAAARPRGVAPGRQGSAAGRPGSAPGRPGSAPGRPGSAFAGRPHGSNLPSSARTRAAMGGSKIGTAAKALPKKKS